MYPPRPAGKKYRDNLSVKKQKKNIEDISKEGLKATAKVGIARAEAARARPVALLRGYYKYNQHAHCKHYTPEEIDKLNGGRKPQEKIEMEDLFTEEELYSMARDDLRKGIWEGAGHKRTHITAMTEDHLINLTCLLRRDKDRKLQHGLSKKWLRKIVQEIENREVFKE